MAGTGVGARCAQRIERGPAQPDLPGGLAWIIRRFFSSQP
jgi:hypothetical protein